MGGVCVCVSPQLRARPQEVEVRPGGARGSAEKRPQGPETEVASLLSHRLAP